jgi:hypothetical protein
MTHSLAKKRKSRAAHWMLFFGMFFLSFVLFESPAHAVCKCAKKYVPCGLCMGNKRPAITPLGCVVVWCADCCGDPHAPEMSVPENTKAKLSTPGQDLNLFDLGFANLQQLL